MEAWESASGVRVSALAPPKGAAEVSPFVDTFTGKSYDDTTRSYKLIEIHDVFLDRPTSGRLFQAQPQCTFFVGEQSAAGIVPHAYGSMMGIQTAQDGSGPYASKTEFTEPVVLLIDQMEKHLAVR